MSAAAVVVGLGFTGVTLAMLASKTKKSKSIASEPSASDEATSEPEPTPAAPTPATPTPTPAPKSDDSTGLLPTRPPITEPLWIPQTASDLADLLAVACTCLESNPGISDPVLTKCTWIGHWRMPDPGRVVEGDHPTVKQALEALQYAVLAARMGMCARLPDRGDPNAPSEPLGPIVIDTTPPKPPPLEPVLPGIDDEPVIPAQPKAIPVEPQPIPAQPQNIPAQPQNIPATPVSIDINALTRYDPTPGYFYQAQVGDTFLGDIGIIARALQRATLLAAESKGWSKEKAQSWAAALAADGKARMAYLNIIQCSAWNDALYGTWGYGSNSVPSAHGRAIRLVPKHDRVYDRLADGQTPIRTIALGKPSDKGKGTATGAGSAYELLWLPPLRVDALLDMNRSLQVVADGLVWPDGSSKYNPPPAVQAKGIDHAPAGPWGCMGGAA